MIEITKVLPMHCCIEKNLRLCVIVEVGVGGGSVLRSSRGRLEAPIPVFYRRSGSLDRHPGLAG